MSQSSYRKKKFNYFGDHLRTHFGEKVYKISLDVGFSCPNRDGTKSKDPCIYCNETGSASLGVDPAKSIVEQIEVGKKALKRKYKAKKYIAYFQAFSNTHSDVETLRKLYYAALEVEDIVGISISTRPDCLDDTKLDLIAEISKKYYTWLELGLQSSHNKTLELINRHDTYENFIEIYSKAKSRNIRICTHIIFGLPGETKEDMLQTVKRLEDLKVDGIKFHLLHVIKNTPLEEMYSAGDVTLFERDDYCNFIAEIVKNLSPEIIIHRLSAEGPSKEVLAPLWSLDKRGVLSQIEDLL